MQTLFFYAAGPFDQRDSIHDSVERLQMRLGEKWKCTSSWLKQEWVDLSDHEIAIHDLGDLRRAHVILLYAGQSTGGGMWVEMGYALALDRPIIQLNLSDGVAPNPFLKLPNVLHCTSEVHVAETMLAMHSRIFQMLVMPERYALH